jgi:predicted flavoprotein YhiN
MAEGQPLKNVAAQAGETRVRGELLITRYGLEGGIVYQLGRVLRAMEEPSLDIDFKPDTSREQLLRKVAGIRVRRWEQARERWRIPDAVSTLLTCSGGIRPDASMDELASVVKSFPLKLTRPRPLPEAISSAGGVGWQEINEDLMLRRLPGVFVAGEMIDWEAPTGGYLLQGAFATGTRAGLAAARWCST